jgi:methylmalonyl-CoA/ethylmalonyl-CoA epimerase
MIDLQFHHVGVGTTDFEGAIRTYEALGHRLQSSVDDPGLNVRIAFLACPGEEGPWIEILAPLAEGGPLTSLVKRRALPSPYHTCYSVAELEPAVADLRSVGFLPLAEPKNALAFDNARVVFLFHAAIGLVELVENPPVWPSPKRHA